jgi:prepilin-type N-terminal cleavage/methylation domain-containing protein
MKQAEKKQSTAQQNNKSLKNQGFTLVEMTVSFALLGLFMVAATFMITATMNIYFQAKGVSYGMQVAGILNDKIAGELEGAVNGDIDSDELADGAGNQATGAVLVAENQIEFTNKEGSHVSISLTEPDSDGAQYLVERYLNADGSSGGADGSKEIEWKFDKNMYMGYSVKELKFTKLSQGDGYADNIIKVDLTITSSRYGDYTTSEYVECYQFDDTIAKGRIVEAVKR